MWREFRKDKLAMFSLVFLAILLLAVYVTSFIMKQEDIVRVDLFSIYAPPSAEHWLGTDYGGRDIFGQLIIGTRNSFTIGLAITILSCLIGLSIGLIAGYFGGKVDNAIMRFIDFVIVLPTLMLIIVFITLVPTFNITTFILIMTAFLWTGKARLIRSKVLTEKELDYVAASKTLGTPNWKIILFKCYLT